MPANADSSLAETVNRRIGSSLEIEIPKPVGVD